jgi:hypothetical protein
MLAKIPDHIEEFLFSCDKEQLVYVLSLSAQWLLQSTNITKEGLMESLDTLLVKQMEKNYARE